MLLPLNHYAIGAMSGVASRESVLMKVVIVIAECGKDTWPYVVWDNYLIVYLITLSMMPFNRFIA